MAIDERRIEAIVADVLERLENGRPVGKPGAEPLLGIHPDLETAVKSARAAFEAYERTPLETRKRVLAAARKVSNLAVDLINRAARRAGSQLPLLHSVEQPTLEIAQALLKYKGIRLNVVTGGPAVVREALNAGKKAITAGPGNPPSVVDETADLDRAARDLIAGASFDNNVICTDEKEAIVVSIVADRLKEAFARAGAVMLQPHQTEKLRGMLLEKEQGPRKYAVINRKYVGKNIHVILGEAGIPCDPARP